MYRAFLYFFVSLFFFLFLLNFFAQFIPSPCLFLFPPPCRIRPLVHAFGHIHESHGTVTDGRTLYLNCAILDRQYFPAHCATVLDLPRRPSVVQPDVTASGHIGSGDGSGRNLHRVTPAILALFKLNGWMHCLEKKDPLFAACIPLPQGGGGHRESGRGAEHALPRPSRRASPSPSRPRFSTVVAAEEVTSGLGRAPQTLVKGSGWAGQVEGEDDEGEGSDIDLEGLDRAYFMK